MAPFIVSVSNRKGGTGKSTTAVHLAASWAAAGKRVLLVDLDTQGHVALCLGVTVPEGAPSAHGIFRGDRRALVEAKLATRHPLLFVAPADRDARAPGDDPPPRILRDALTAGPVAALYDRIVIDTGPALDHWMIGALAASQGVLLPFLPHPLSLHGIQQFSKIFLHVRMMANPELKLFGLVACQFNAASLVHRQTLQAVIAQYGSVRLMGAIRNDIRLAEAAGQGRTVFESAPSSRGAQDYRAMALMLEERWPIAALDAPAPTFAAAAS